MIISADKPTTIPAPREEYARRLAARQQEAAVLARRDRVFGNWRLAVFASGLLLAWFCFHAPFLSPWLLPLPVLGFLWLAARHDRILQNRKRMERAVMFYQQGLRRLENQWQGTGNAGSRFLKAEHTYAMDLDIFGRASLFELVCTARTRMGENCLADWLQTPAASETIRLRQQAIEELRPRLDFREDMGVLGEQTRAALKPEELLAWSAEPDVVFPAWERGVLAVLVIAVLTVSLVALMQENWTLVAIAVGVEQIFVFRLRERVQQAVTMVQAPGRDLALLGLLLARIEQEPFTAPRLLHLRSLLNGRNPIGEQNQESGEERSTGKTREQEPKIKTAAEVLPSARIERLQRLLELLQMPHNPLLGILDKIVQLTPFCAFAIADWKCKHGAHLADWLRVVGEVEALAALAGYAWEHPDDVFPEIIPDALCLEARGLAHPLLPAASAIRNDVEFSPEQRLYIVSGSNMSGKSTLLRAIGVNVVLALAGAPVRAHAMRICPLQIGASLRTQDSLEAGISRFYAEILRLRQIVDLTRNDTALLFLLDEILHGTNSHDRRQGAEAILRALIRKNSLGLVTTHDLALARIADDTSLHALNVHLEDQLLNGQIHFDYHLRPGVVAKSNALELMRAVGLEV